MFLNKSSELLLLNYSFSVLDRFYENSRLTDPKIGENSSFWIIFWMSILFEIFYKYLFLFGTKSQKEQNGDIRLAEITRICGLQHQMSSHWLLSYFDSY